MKQRVSPTLIGVFVFGALAVLIGGIIVFGSGRFFRPTKEFVLYFDGSVNGLHVGAPVKLKGVDIGSVENILLQLEKGTALNKIPVIVQIDPEKLTSRGIPVTEAFDPSRLAEFVQRGLRGQLQTESLLTGVLYVGLDLFPGTPINLVQTPGGDYKYQEIPTIETELAQAQDTITRTLRKLQAIDFDAVTTSVTKAGDGVSQLANSPDLKAILHSLQQTTPELRQAIADFRSLTTTANNRVTNVSDDFHNVSVDLRQTLLGAQGTIEQFTATLRDAQNTIITVRANVEPDSAIFYELTKTLRELSSATRSIRLLSNSLGRNPQSVIVGYPEDREEK
jgi:paraquat-inducible protein B